MSMAGGFFRAIRARSFGVAYLVFKFEEARQLSGAQAFISRFLHNIYLSSKRFPVPQLYAAGCCGEICLVFSALGIQAEYFTPARNYPLMIHLPPFERLMSRPGFEARLPQMEYDSELLRLCAHKVARHHANGTSGTNKGKHSGGWRVLFQ